MNDDIVIYHIGGDDENNLNLGPIQRVIDSSEISPNIQIILFDIRPGVGEKVAVDKELRKGLKIKVVSACIYSHKKKLKFLVNKMPLSSEVFSHQKRNVL